MDKRNRWVLVAIVLGIAVGFGAGSLMPRLARPSADLTQENLALNKSLDALLRAREQGKLTAMELRYCRVVTTGRDGRPHTTITMYEQDGCIDRDYEDKCAASGGQAAGDRCN